MKYKYEIRQIDAWAEDEFSWSWNASYKIGEFETAAEDHKKAFLRALHRLGIVSRRGSCRVEYDGSVYELVSRKTSEPFFAAIPVNF